MARPGVATTTWTRAMSVTGLVIAALLSVTDARAQLPLPASTVFEMTGFIQAATLDAGSDPFRGGTITLNNHVVKVPKNTIFQMPATSLTWAELFTQAPTPWGPTQTGLALNDRDASGKAPAFTFEVTVQGNRVETGNCGGALPAGAGSCYIAGLIFISQQSLQAHQGFINFINYAVGEMRVGGALGNATSGTRVRINDPKGRFSRVLSHDLRFTIDEENPTIKTETGFPMCLPRFNPATTPDPKCPQGNRPLNGTATPAGAAVFTVDGRSGSYQSAFTMPGRPVPTAAEIANNGATRATPDAWRMAPFEIGDYVTVKGPLVNDVVNGAPSQYIDAVAIDASVGIFTMPGTLPNYVAIDVLLMGTGPINDPTLAQEGARRLRVEGFTTDISTAIMVSAVDVDACSGTETDRVWNIQAVDPGPPSGAVAGRWRFRPGAPLFDLKGFPFLPPTREAHAVSLAGTVTTLNGLTAGQYQAPNFEFILPENLGIGSPKVPANFEGMPFLVDGSGPRAAFSNGLALGRIGQLSPWPGATAPAAKVCP